MNRQSRCVVCVVAGKANYGLPMHTDTSIETRGEDQECNGQTARHRLLVPCILLLVLLVGSTWLIVNNSQQKLIEFKSRQIANVVANQAKTARSLYASSIVAKLKRDGFGASTDSDTQRGVVPIPAQFLKALAHKSDETRGGSYLFRPLSKWNLSADQGLKDEFQRWAWSKLEAQNNAQTSGPRDWQPVWRLHRLAMDC